MYAVTVAWTEGKSGDINQPRIKVFVVKNSFKNNRGVAKYVWKGAGDCIVLNLK